MVMQKNKQKNKIVDYILGVLVFAILIGCVVLVYNYEKDKSHRNLAKRIAELSPRGGPPETIDGLKKAIAAYEAQIELNIKEGAQAGSYWKILAVRLADKGMHRDAIDALKQAMHYNSSEPTLFYLTGESASIVAANALQFSINNASEKDFYQELAESAYKKAIELDDSYAKPLLGLGILYAFDMNRPAEAVPLLERYLGFLPNDVKTMFVLARAYYMTENFDKAVEMYDRIILRSKDPTVKSGAQNNKEIILEQMHG